MHIASATAITSCSAACALRIRRGVVAHSDGDVVIHALCDAMLGALGRATSASTFPTPTRATAAPTAACSCARWPRARKAAGYRISQRRHHDVAEAPRIAAHRAAMAANLAADLGVDSSAINVKATTTERMGFIGRGEGLAALACVLLDA